MKNQSTSISRKAILSIVIPKYFFALICLCVYLFNSINVKAQCLHLEAFESFTTGITVNSFTSFGQNFSIGTNSTAATNGQGFHLTGNSGTVGTGWNGTSTDNQYLDNSGGGTYSNTGSSFSINSSTAFHVKKFWLYLSSDDGITSVLGTSGTITVVGKSGSTTVFSKSVTSSSWNGSYGTAVGFNLIDMSTFGGSDNSFASITSLTINSSAGSNMNYLAIDGWSWGLATDPIPSVITSAANSITSSGATLNGAINANSSVASTANSFQYSTSSTLATGVITVAASTATSTGTSSTSISKAITGLISGTTYYFRAVGTNCNATILGPILNFTAGASNTAPTFVNGSPQTLTVCQDASIDVKSLLHVNDVDAGQTETWSQASAPSHGSLTISSATAISGSSNITPGGTINYIPASNYSGVDAFTIQVSDGIASVNMIVNVTVNPTPNITVSPTSQSVCNLANTSAVLFSSNVLSTSYTWSNNNTSIGIGASGSGSFISSFVATNSGSTPTTGTFTVTPQANSCIGPVQTFVINVTPSPTCLNGGAANASCGCNCPVGYSGQFCQNLICQPTAGSTNITVCNNYSWVANNNTNYTISGTYVHTFVNAGGCDSVHTLNLTVNHASSNTPTIANVCNSYTWTANNQTYTASGTYTQSFTNINGCDSTVTLNLTIKYSSINSPTVANVCNSYTWAANNQTYTASGTYTQSFTNINGCDSTVALNVTIRHSSINSPTVANVCNSYTWTANNQTYTASGTYTQSFTNVNGCDSTVTLNLTIRYSSINSPTVANVCNSYTWTANNQTYTASGTYTQSFTNINGCDSTVTLNLTIRHSSINSPTVANVCNSYTWTANNQTYTTSGTYSQSFTNMNGCDSTVTLNLTIRHSSINSPTVANVCNSYTWTANNQTYTSTGTYTQSFANIAGCDSSVVLQLAIRNSSNSSLSVSTIGCYTWSSNNTTYTVSGTYTITYTNAVGCDSVSTLNLTIIPGVYLNAKAILAGPYNAAIGLMSDSLRDKNLIPLSEPYSSSPYNKTPISETNGETTTTALLSATGPNAIVDWVLIELRSASNSATIIANKRALIQRDGDIVGTDGVSPVYFSTVPNGAYFVSIKHRNHLGVMSPSTLNFSGCAIVSYDFSLSPVYINSTITNAPRKTIGTIYAMWSADANNNKNVKYNGLSNDKDFILSAVGSATPNNTVSPVYRVEDLNMDGKIRFNNTDNDRVIIIDNVGTSTPNNILNQHTPN